VRHSLPGEAEIVLPEIFLMKINISDRKRISAVQKEFNDAFPFLRIEFFTRSHRAEKGSGKKHLIIPDHKTIGECRRIHNSSFISITPGMKVSKLEQIFLDEFGLAVQVFRQSGRVWLETTMTDDWTLAEQNHQGEELSRQVTKRKEAPFPADDYHDLE
jgi:hypothetical protein